MVQRFGLDDPQVYKEYDSHGMLACLNETPAQCQQAWEAAGDFSLPREYAEVDRVVVLGMGGSAIGGDLVAGLAALRAKVPIIVVRDYILPAYVDALTLVIASSYSGETAETLSAFTQALQTGARKIAITTGGKLLDQAKEAGVPSFTFSYKAQPRAALPYSLLPLLRILQKLKLMKEDPSEVNETVNVLKELTAELNQDVSQSRNPAKQLAQRLYGLLPVVYGSGYLAEVARRWKTQFNENAKSWAFHEVLPELDHNAVVGYRVPTDFAGRARVLMLRSEGTLAQIRRRQEVTGDLLDRAGVSHEYAEARGHSPLSQVMSLVLFGDYVSVYLALLYRIDPTPVAVIDYLKQQLAKG